MPAIKWLRSSLFMCNILMPQFCAKNLLANTENKHHQAHRVIRRKKGERDVQGYSEGWGPTKARAQRKAKKVKIQTNNERKKVFRIFFTSFNEMLSSVGVVLLSSPLFDVFSILSTRLLLNLFVSLCVMCMYLCVFYAYFLFLWVQCSQPLKLAPFGDAACGCARAPVPLCV